MWRWRFCDLNKLIKIQTVETVAMLKKHPKYTAETHTHTHSLNRFLLFLCSCLPFFSSTLLSIRLPSLFVFLSLSSYHFCPRFLPPPLSSSLSFFLSLSRDTQRNLFPSVTFTFPVFPSVPFFFSLFLLPLCLISSSVYVCLSPDLSATSSLARLSVTSCHSKLDWRDPSNPHSCH